MKKVLLIIGIILTSLIILISIPLIMFSKNYKVPEEQYKVEETYFMKHFDNEFVELVNSDTKNYINVNLTEVYINQFIKRELFKDNPKYMVSAYEGELEYKYMYISEGSFKVGIRGLYTDVKDNQVDIILSVDLLAGKTRLYRTGILIRVNIETLDDTYVFKVNRIYLGRTKMPLKRELGLATYITKKINGKTLDEVINDSLPFGYYNKNEVSLEVTEASVLEYAKEKHVGFGTLIKLIYNHDLLSIDVVNDGVSLSLNMGAVRKKTTAPSKPNFEPLTSPEEQAEFMVGLNGRLLAGFLNSPINPYVDLNEVEANQVLDYSLKDKVKFSQDFPIKLSAIEEVNYYIESSNVFLTMENSNITLYLEFLVKRDNEPNLFIIQIKMNSTLEMVNENIIITMISASVGNITLTNEEVMEIINVYNEGMFEDGKLTISKQQLSEMFSGAEMIIDDVKIVNGKLRIYYTFTGI
jgi:hypothetical protein